MYAKAMIIFTGTWFALAGLVLHWRAAHFLPYPTARRFIRT